MGSIMVAFIQGVVLNNFGGGVLTLLSDFLACDNAKKWIESGALGGKGKYLVKNAL